jgi:hypothetical protein
VRVALRLKHYSYRRELAYTGCVTRYILFHNKRHPKDLVALDHAHPRPQPGRPGCPESFGFTDNSLSRSSVTVANRPYTTVNAMPRPPRPVYRLTVQPMPLTHEFLTRTSFLS